MPVFESLAALIIFAVWLTGAAILRNGVPVSAPPGRFARISAYLTNNVAETRDGHPFPELRTRYFDLAPDALLARVDMAMDLLGWLHASGVDPMTRRAEIRTPLLGFTDDLVAEVVVLREGRSKLRVRSASRVGRGDLGANAGHVVRLYEAVSQVPGAARKQ